MAKKTYVKQPIDILDIPQDAALQQEEEYEMTFEGVVRYPNQPKFSLRARTNAVTLDEVLPAIEDFLRGMGFLIEGHLDIVADEETEI